MRLLNHVEHLQNIVNPPASNHQATGVSVWELNPIFKKMLNGPLAVNRNDINHYPRSNH